MNTITVTLDNKSLLDIRSEFPELFYAQSWYEDEKFAQQKFTGTWKVPLEPVEGSLNKTWEEQQKLVSKGVAPAAVLAYAILKHFKDTGERAFESVYARTSSVHSDGYHVGIGIFDAGGLVVSDGWDNERYSALGLAVAWKVEAGTSSIEPLSDLNLESLSARIEALEQWRERVQQP